MWTIGEKKKKKKKSGLQKKDGERKRIKNEMNPVSDILWDSTVRVRESIILLPSLMWKSTAVPFM